MFAKSFVIAGALMLCTAAAIAQTHSQTLERAIFTEETAGDQATAIQIYERLAVGHAVPREIAARARARLFDIREREAAQRRGAAGQVDPPPAPPAPPAQPVAGGRGGRGGGRGGDGAGVGNYAEFYDATRNVSVAGTVTGVEWSRPHVVVFLRSADGQSWGFVLAPPENLERSGWMRDSLQAGDQVIAEGTLARGVGTCPAALPNGCATFANGARHANGRQVRKVDRDGNVVRPGVQPAPGAGGGGRGGRRGGAPPQQ